MFAFKMIVFTLGRYRSSVGGSESIINRCKFDFPCYCYHITFLSVFFTQILVFEKVPGAELVWEPGEPGHIPPGAIIGGTAADGQHLYIAKVGIHPGLYDRRKAEAEYEYHGATSSDTWDILILKYSKCQCKELGLSCHVSLR